MKQKTLNNNKCLVLLQTRGVFPDLWSEDALGSLKGSARFLSVLSLRHNLTKDNNKLSIIDHKFIVFEEYLCGKHLKNHVLRRGPI